MSTRARRGRSPSGPGLTSRGLPAARAALGPARFDDAVRGPRARRLPADDARRFATRVAAVSATRACSGSASCWVWRPDPQRGRVAGPDLGPARGGRARDRATRSAVRMIAHRGGRGAHRVRAVGLRNWSSFGSPLPGQAVTNAFSVPRASTSSPGTTRRPWRATLRSGRRGLLEMRVDGLAHNLGNVLLLPGFPLSAHRSPGAAVAGPRPRGPPGGRWSA